MTPRNRPDHLFLASDGCLYDTRTPWAEHPPLREHFSGHCGQVDGTNDIKACLRAGSSTDLGGYPLYFAMRNGEVASFAHVKANLRDYLEAFYHDDFISRANRIYACVINWEDSDLTCVSGAKIPSAYGE